MKMRLLICGDRDWNDYERIFSLLLDIIGKRRVECVIEGEANGADLISRRVAEYFRIAVKPFPADWNKLGRAAGPIRNSQMLKEGKPTHVFAFHNDIKSSMGTKDMLRKALAVLPAKNVRLFTEKNEIKVTKELLK